MEAKPPSLSFSNMPLAANHTGLAATSPSPYFGGGLGTHTSTPTFSDQSSSPFGMRQMTLTPVQKHEKPPVHSASSVPSATAMSSFGRIDRGKFREILDEDGDSSMGGGTLSPCSPSPALHPHCSSPFQQQEDVMMSSIRQEIEDIQKTTSPSPQTTLPPLHEILPGYYNPSPTSSPILQQQQHLQSSPKPVVPQQRYLSLQQQQQHQQQQQQHPQSTSPFQQVQQQHYEHPQSTSPFQQQHLPPQQHQPQHHHSKPVLETVKPTKVCDKCKTSSTPRWRRGPKGRQTLCNSCGLKYLSDKKKRKYDHMMSICLKHSEPVE